MTAYYNEIDPFAAAWLRELIKAGHIAPGEVDERSIEDVRPDDLLGFTQCHFFAGIGVWSYALRRAGWSDNTPVWTGSCPCQSFSASGKRGGFSDKRHLWPAWFRLIGECRPDVIFGEQVASKDGLAWLDVVSADLEGAGYAVGAADLCAAGVGAPHIRQRLYFVGESDLARSQSRRQSIETVGYGDSLIAASGNGELADSRRRVGLEVDDGASARQCDVKRSGGVSGLADAASGQFQESQRRPDQRTGIGPDRKVGNMGDTARRGLGMRGSASGESGRIAQPGEIDGMGQSKSERCSDDFAESSRSQEQIESPGISDGAMDHSIGLGWQKIGNDDGRDERIIAHANGFAEYGHGPPQYFGGCPTNGFWRDAEWIYCRDGKYRPIEPGTFPLVTGAPSRVGRLRGYGNALNAEAAIAFIESWIEERNVGAV